MIVITKDYLKTYERGFTPDKWYVCSDTHFGHTNIIKYCDRPFKDVDEMDEALISNWNSVVTDNDIVVHLGDVGFGTNHFIELVSRLNGYIILLKGNHDRSKQIAKLLNSGAVNEYYNNSFQVFWDENEDILFTHHPIAPANLSDSIKLNIHGHLHNNPYDWDDLSRYANVSMEMLNFTPTLLSNYVGSIR